ncbi:MAG: glycoside hydrolase family 97 protein [Chitinophagaceae bacterium]|nr:glycoside hydrolase family 97 protein [Chitinophagaceae bacterium]
MLFKRFIILLVLFTVTIHTKAQERKYQLISPDGKIKVLLSFGTTISYNVSFQGVEYLSGATASVTLADGRVLGANPRVAGSKTLSVNNVLKNPIGISSELKEHYNELLVKCSGNYSVQFRAYPEGFAYRFVTSFKDSIIVASEKNDFTFKGDYSFYVHPELSESNYKEYRFSGKDSSVYSSLPVLVKPDMQTAILIHESDVLSYPCLGIKTRSDNTLTGMQARYPRKTVAGGNSNFNLLVTETENYIARISGSRSLPWRLVAFAENHAAILSNQLVYLLATPSVLTNTSWIRPGKVAWDWWNALNLSGVNFKTGFNTETYKYYIDFAARNGLEYVNLDEGWSDQFDLLKVTDKLNMEELVRYAKEKKVGLILWCVWRTLDAQMEDALKQFERWGISGLKVDFMDRDDQVVVDFHERLLRKAAEKKMLVSYHGAYHPTGHYRTFPNNINVEGVRGLEWNKFNQEGAGPENDLLIPFIRMFAGPMDYTPGAMHSFNKADWRANFNRPSSQGTRCHQLAMYIAYFAPLQMLSDAPTSYENEPPVLKFIAGIPTVWDETIPLAGAAGSFLGIARRKGETWYVAAMNSWNAHSLPIDFSFLGTRRYKAVLFADGRNADRVGDDYITTERELSGSDKLNLELAPGGGWAARLEPVK